MAYSKKEQVYPKIVEGDIVRSYDFERGLKNFVEGRVVGFKDIEGCTRYHIKVHRDVVRGEDLPRDAVGFRWEVYPPVNGTLTTLGRYTNGVHLVPIPVPVCLGRR